MEIKTLKIVALFICCADLVACCCLVFGLPNPCFSPFSFSCFTNTVMMMLIKGALMVGCVLLASTGSSSAAPAAPASHDEEMQDLLGGEARRERVVVAPLFARLSLDWRRRIAVGGVFCATSIAQATTCFFLVFVSQTFHLFVHSGDARHSVRGVRVARRGGRQPSSRSGSDHVYISRHQRRVVCGTQAHRRVAGEFVFICCLKVVSFFHLSKKPAEVLCLKSHHHALRLRSVGFARCDRCHEPQKGAGVEMWSCGPCDWDVCRPCLKKDQADKSEGEGDGATTCATPSSWQGALVQSVVVVVVFVCCAGRSCRFCWPRSWWLFSDRLSSIVCFVCFVCLFCLYCCCLFCVVCIVVVLCVALFVVCFVSSIFVVCFVRSIVVVCL
jgi:hypothetical protein